MLPFGHLAIRSTERGWGDRWTHFTQDEQIALMSLWCIFRRQTDITGTSWDEYPDLLFIGSPNDLGLQGLTSLDIPDILNASYQHHTCILQMKIV